MTDVEPTSGEQCIRPCPEGWRDDEADTVADPTATMPKDWWGNCLANHVDTTSFNDVNVVNCVLDPRFLS